MHIFYGVIFLMIFFFVKLQRCNDTISIYLESRVRYIMEEVIPRDGDVDIMKIAEETVINASKAAKLHALTKTESERNKMIFLGSVR